MELKRTSIHLEGWDETIHIREITLGERRQLQPLFDGDKKQEALARFLLFVIVNEDGTQFYSEKNKADIDKLPAQAADAITAAALELSGLAAKKND